MRYEYLGERRRIHGKWYYPGQIYEIDRQINDKFKKVGKGKKVDKAVIKEEKLKNDDEKKVRDHLKTLKMYDLRKIGNKYGVKDTKHSELVEEIINAKKDRGEI